MGFFKNSTAQDEEVKSGTSDPDSCSKQITTVDQVVQGSERHRVPDINACRMFGFGVGHFYNDLCAGMWFSYFMIFIESVLGFRSTLAGLLMLIGQVIDAICNPLLGLASDSSVLPKWLYRIGRRTSWHAIGTICVTVSFPFIFNSCLLCKSGTSEWWSFAWFVFFIIIFQFGWASVQISHLALIPELSQNVSRRTTMNSLRYAFTVLANLAIYGMLAVMLHTTQSDGKIGKSDKEHFSNAAYIIVGVGILTSFMFYLLTKEPKRRSPSMRRCHMTSTCSVVSETIKMSWLNWLTSLQFYQISVLYTLSRLYMNLSQVYFPFYVTFGQGYPKSYVAYIPLTAYAASFIITAPISVPFINRRLNIKAIYIIGSIIGIGNCIWMLFDLKGILIYIVASIFGGVQALLLVASLAFASSLINKNTESAAFVYGAMSFMDKLANGVSYQIIEIFNPHCSDDEANDSCKHFYRYVMGFIPGGCLILSLIVLITLLPKNIGNRSSVHPVETSNQDNLPNQRV